MFLQNQNLQRKNVSESRTPTRQFVELTDSHRLGESTTDRMENLHSQLLSLRMTSREIDKRINSFVASLCTHLEMIIQSLKN